MLALKGSRKPDGGLEAQPKLVLPRVLRKPARMLSRLEWHIPRNAGIKGVAALFLLTGLGGVVMGDRVNELISQATSSAGLAVHVIRITGQSETSELDVLRSLALPQNASLFTLDLEAARRHVETLPWVAHATLKKLYPDVLDISITERTAFALWRDGSDASLIDRDGGVITAYTDTRFASLPLVVGHNANKRATEIAALLARYPKIQPRVQAAVLVSDRRWNLVLDNGVEVKLPENDAAGALDRLTVLDTDKGLLSRDLKGVDLRLADRVIVQLTDEALTRRKQLLKAKKGSAA